jgi:transmembrane sensor
VSNIYNFSPERKVYEEAGLWVAKLDRGLSSKEEATLHQWLAESASHREALVKSGQVWDKSEVLSKLADLFPEAVEQPAAIQRRWGLPAIAASITVLMLGVWLGMPQLNPADSTAEITTSNVEGLYKTPIGESTTVNLPDGTELILNTNTTVRVYYSEKQRLLRLDQGELHVNVAHDESRPLSVIAGGQVVQAVGTAFNIELNEGRIVDLVVTEGKVLVAEQSSNFNPASIELIAMPSSSLSVSMGQRILLGDLDIEIEFIEPSEIEDSEIEVQLSWQKGNLVFRGESLEEAIEEISRYTSVRFVFLNEDLKQLKVAGLFQTGDVDGLLTALNDNFHIDYERIDQRVLLGNR